MDAVEMMSLIENYCPDIETDLCQGNYEDLLDYPLRRANVQFHSASGASKYVIFPYEQSDWVIKIPYDGTFLESWDEYTGEKIYDFYPFENALIAENYTGSDYCASEVYFWQEADKRGLGACFAKTIYLGTIHNTPIYQQERATIWGDIACWERPSRPVEEQAAMEEKIEAIDGDCFCVEWLCDFEEYYGEQKLYALMRFLQEFHIGDLHYDNFGYINDRPVITDYSDFQS